MSFIKKNKAWNKYDNESALQNSMWQNSIFYSLQIPHSLYINIHYDYEMFIQDTGW